MKMLFVCLALAASAVVCAAQGTVDLKIGDKAPALKLKGTDDNEYTLAQFQSKSAVALIEAKGTPRTLGWDGNEQIALLPHSTGESGYFEHPRVRDAFFDILEAQGFGEIDTAESGRRMYTDINRVLQRVIRPTALTVQTRGDRDGG